MNFKETKTPVQNFRFLEENFRDYVSKEKNFSDQWNEFLIKNSFPDKSDLSDCQNLSGENKISLIFDEVAKFYRKFGYLLADLNPLEDEKTKDEIQSKINSYLNKFNFSESDFNIKINNEKSLYFGKTFKEALNTLENKYLNKMSAEFEHIIDHEKYLWLCNHFEEKFEISKEEKEKIALDLMEIDLFEQFIHLKFQGSKRFSIEGADSSMIFFDEFLKESAKLSATNVVMGMAHRGRLNFLTKMCGESYSSILGQFAGGNYFDEEIGNSGDVKYHLGGLKICEFSESSIEVILMPNPSHLEAVNGPVLGLTRVMQDSLTKKDDSINSKKKIITF
jgi:2-oxoglutarate dehydrogenase E1 component